MRGNEYEKRGRIERGREGGSRSGGEKKRETHVHILDYLPYGHPEDSRPVYQKKPLVQAVGEAKFVLPKKDKIPAVYERVYIGEGERDVIDHVIKRLRYTELTQTAKVELSYILEKMVKDDEERFIRAFNEAKPITTRLHTLDLMPGIGKKLMWAIVEEREKGEFSCFEDLTKRVKGLHHPEKIIAKRIEEEIMEENIKYKIFTV
jgi:putative nucleotide binding protein